MQTAVDVVMAGWLALLTVAVYRARQKRRREQAKKFLDDIRKGRI